MLLKEIKNLENFLSMMRPFEHKQKYEWMLAELLSIDEEDVRAVAKRMISHIKDI